MDIMKHLNTDHHNVARILNILESQLDRLHQIKPVDFDLMRDVMRYMTHYPDRVHHPLEDLVIQKLIEHGPSVQKIGENLTREH